MPTFAEISDAALSYEKSGGQCRETVASLRRAMMRAKDSIEERSKFFLGVREQNVSMQGGFYPNPAGIADHAVGYERDVAILEESSRSLCTLLHELGVEIKDERERA